MVRQVLGAVALMGASGVVAVAVGQVPAGAPLPTVVEGLVVDAMTGLPVPNVQVRFDSGERITSDERGRYAIEGISPGHHQVALVTARCNATFAELDLAPGQIKRVAFQVPSEVAGKGPTQDDLKKASEGDYYTRPELEEMRARNLLEVLRRVAPDMVGTQGGQPGSSGVLMSRTRTVQGVAPPMVVFDGIVMGDAWGALRDLKPQDVYSLEVLRGASRGWVYGTGGSGGVIRVETRAGEAGYGVAHPDRCDIGDWPLG